MDAFFCIDFYNFCYSENTSTPWKINMEPTKHPFRKENHLPNLHEDMFHVNLQGCRICNLGLPPLFSTNRNLGAKGLVRPLGDGGDFPFRLPDFWRLRFLKRNELVRKPGFIFQPSIFRGKLLVLGKGIWLDASFNSKFDVKFVFFAFQLGHVH